MKWLTHEQLCCVVLLSVFLPAVLISFYQRFHRCKFKRAILPARSLTATDLRSPSFTKHGTHPKPRAHPPPLSPPSSLSANIHVSFVIRCGDDVNLCCQHWLSLLLIDLFLEPNELLCSLFSFVLQPPSSSLQLLLKLLRLTKVNGSGCPLLLLFVAIDRGPRWIFIHLAGAWIECVGCLG